MSHISLFITDRFNKALNLGLLLSSFLMHPLQTFDIIYDLCGFGTDNILPVDVASGGY
jgi:hypothetical protein